MNETNRARFRLLWAERRYKEALRLPVQPVRIESGTSPFQSLLFGSPEEMKQSFGIGMISFGEFMYDVLRLDPRVIEGIDFARAEDLSSLFTLSRFAQTVDLTVDTGDIAQMQGYVAERMVAGELQAKGYDVEFPEASNQAGYDLLVDGVPFQVKNLLSPAGVYEHFEKYPDIPVYVNEELATHFENYPLVYATHVQHAEVVKATKDSLAAAADLTDFEIPYISLLISTVYQTKKLIFNEASLGQAVFNVISDTSSKIILGALGKYTAAMTGVLLFGPAGGLIGSGAGAILGASQGYRLSARIKSLTGRQEEQALIEAAEILSARVCSQVDRKVDYKQRRLTELVRELKTRETEAGQVMAEEITGRAEAEIRYARNKQQELRTLLKDARQDKQPVIKAVGLLLGKVAQTGVHPSHYQQELQKVTHGMKLYLRKQ